MPGHTPDEKGELTCPDITGGTNFWPPTYDPRTRLFFVNAREVCATYYAWKPEFTPGDRFTGGAGQRAREPDCPAYGALRAIDPTTGDRKWEFKLPDPVDRRSADDRSGLIFSGDNEGNLLALDSRTGKLLWRYQMGVDPARHVADHLHARRPAAPARPGGHDAHVVGVCRMSARVTTTRD